MTRSSISTYLLAKSRVAHVPHGERNYHVFYWLCNGAFSIERELWKLQPPKAYKYLNNTMDGEQSTQLAELRAAMSAVNISPSVQHCVFRVLVLILTLGNITYTAADDGGSFLVRDAGGNLTGAELCAADLLGLKQAESRRNFEMVLTSRRVRDVRRRLSTSQAKQGTDALARCLYQMLFDYLVCKMNEAPRDNGPRMEPKSRRQEERYIGILDIFGFEDLAPYSKNNFEQLCINYANERLHSFSLQQLISADARFYLEEGLSPPPVEGVLDNEDICLAICGCKGQLGIFNYLDEACSIAVVGSPDEYFCKKMRSNVHSSVIRPSKRDDSTEFIIRHFASDVTYTADGFCEKNVDILPTEVREFLSSAQCDPFISQELCLAKKGSQDNAIADSSRPSTVPATPTSSMGGNQKPTSSTPGTQHTQRLPTGAKLSHDLAPVDSSSGSSDEEVTEHGDAARPLTFPMMLGHRIQLNSRRMKGKQRRKRMIAKSKTLASLFAVQVEDLMATLNRTSSFFIRCIKPNDSQSAFSFDSRTVRRQLETGGILGILHFMTKGFPCRIKYADLWSKYKKFLTPTLQESMHPRDFVEAVLQFLNIPLNTFQMGHSRVFSRFGNLHAIERIEGLEDEIERERFVQETARLWLQRKLRRVLVVVKICCRLEVTRRLIIARAVCRKLSEDVLVYYRTIYLPRKLVKAAVILQRIRRQVLLQKSHRKQAAIRIENAWRNAVSRRFLKRSLKCIRFLNALDCFHQRLALKLAFRAWVAAAQEQRVLIDPINKMASIETAVPSDEPLAATKALNEADELPWSPQIRGCKTSFAMSLLSSRQKRRLAELESTPTKRPSLFPMLIQSGSPNNRTSSVDSHPEFENAIICSSHPAENTSTLHRDCPVATKVAIDTCTGQRIIDVRSSGSSAAVPSLTEFIESTVSDPEEKRVLYKHAPKLLTLTAEKNDSKRSSSTNTSPLDALRSGEGKIIVRETVTEVLEDFGVVRPRNKDRRAIEQHYPPSVQSFDSSTHDPDCLEMNERPQSPRKLEPYYDENLNPRHGAPTLYHRKTGMTALHKSSSDRILPSQCHGLPTKNSESPNVGSKCDGTSSARMRPFEDFQQLADNYYRAEQNWSPEVRRPRSSILWSFDPTQVRQALPDDTVEDENVSPIMHASFARQKGISKQHSAHTNIDWPSTLTDSRRFKTREITGGPRTKRRERSLTKYSDAYHCLHCSGASQFPVHRSDNKSAIPFDSHHPPCIQGLRESTSCAGHLAFASEIPTSNSVTYEPVAPAPVGKASACDIRAASPPETRRSVISRSSAVRQRQGLRDYGPVTSLNGGSRRGSKMLSMSPRRTQRASEATPTPRNGISGEIVAANIHKYRVTTQPRFERTSLKFSEPTGGASVRRTSRIPRPSHERRHQRLTTSRDSNAFQHF